MPRSRSSSPNKSVHRSSSHHSSSHTPSDWMRPPTYTGPVLPRPPTTPIPSSIPTQTPVAALAPPQSSFGQVLKDGFAFGIGSSIAQRIFGPTKQVEHVIVTKPNETIPTGTLSKEIQQKPEQHMYNQCILEGGTETVCKQYLIE